MTNKTHHTTGKIIVQESLLGLSVGNNGAPSILKRKVIKLSPACHSYHKRADLSSSASISLFSSAVFWVTDDGSAVPEAVTSPGNPDKLLILLLKLRILFVSISSSVSPTAGIEEKRISWRVKLTVIWTDLTWKC